MPKFEVLQGGKDAVPPEEEKAKLRHELYDIVDKYSCGIDVKPEWCVYGIGRGGERGVLYWIRPSEEAEFVAHQIARLETQLGGDAKAEKTERHPEFKKKPVWQQGDDEDNLVFGE